MKSNVSEVGVETIGGQSGSVFAEHEESGDLRKESVASFSLFISIFFSKILIPFGIGPVVSQLVEIDFSPQKPTEIDEHFRSLDSKWIACQSTKSVVVPAADGEDRRIHLQQWSKLSEVFQKVIREEEIVFENYQLL